MHHTFLLTADGPAKQGLRPWAKVRKTRNWGLSLLAVLIIFVVSLILFPQPAQAVLANGFPERLAIYYGYPSLVNQSAGNLTLASDVFNDYDLVIFGNGIDSPSHQDHLNTQSIINNIRETTRVYGYVDLCAEGGSFCSNLTLSEIQARTDRWAAMGAVGIFLDQAGYEYGVSRSRLNSAVDYIHSKGLSAFVNTWNPDDIFSSDVHPTLNPSGTTTLLNGNDYALDESFAVTLSQWQDPVFLINKANKELAYKKQFGTKIATVNTLAQNGSFDQAQFDYVWWMTLLYGFDAMAWGETAFFSSENSSLPFRPRPNPNHGDIGNAISPITVTHNAPIHARATDEGVIQVDTTTHVGQYTSSSAGNVITQSGTASTDLIYGDAVLTSTEITLTIRSNTEAITSYRVFIDSDENAATGFLHGGNTNVGANYLVENGHLYGFTGETQTAWSWTWIGPVNHTGIGTTEIQVPVSFSQIGVVSGSSTSILVENLSASWATLDLLPRFPGVWRVR